MKKLFKGSVLAIMALAAMGASAMDTGGFKPVKIQPVSGSTIAPGTSIELIYSEDLTVVNYELCATWSCDEDPEFSSEANPYVDEWGDAKVMSFQTPTPWDGVVLGQTYKLTLPEGLAQTQSGAKLTAPMVLYYTINYSRIEVTIMDNCETEQISNPLTIFTSPESDTMVINADKVVTLAYNGTTYKGVVGPGAWYGYQITFEGLPSPITAPGTYQLTFPAGVFTDGTLQNELITRTWTILEPQTCEAPSVEPAAFSEVTAGTKVVLSFTNPVMGNMGQAELYNETKDKTSYTAIYSGDSYETRNTLSFFFTPEGAENGDVIICRVPLGAGVEEDTYLKTPAVEITYTFKSGSAEVGPLKYKNVEPAEGTIDIAGGAAGLGIFNIGVDNADGNITVAADAAQQISFRNTDAGIDYPLGEVFFSAGFGSPTIIINTQMFAENYEYITAPGTYVMTIPEGVFTSALGAVNEEWVFTWTIGGEVSEYLEVVRTVPTNGAIVSALDSFKLYFDTEVTLADSASATILGGLFPRVMALSVDESDAKCVNVNITSPITTQGTYTINIVEGQIKAGNLVNAALSYNVTVGDATLRLVSIEPSNVEPLEKIADGQTFTVAINRAAEVGYILGTWSLPEGCPDDSIVDCRMQFTKNEDGTYSWTNNAWDFYLLKGYTYPLTLACYDVNPYEGLAATLIGNIVVEYNGAYESNVSYSYAFQSVTPEPGTMLTADNCATVLSFTEAVDFVSGFVTEGGQMAATDDNLTAVSNTEKTEWTITAPEYFVQMIAGDFTYVLKFADEYGNPVILSDSQETSDLYNSYGENYMTDKADVSISIRYMSLDGAVMIDVDPEAGKVEKLYEFTFTNPNSFSLNEIRWSYLESPNAIELYDGAGTRVAMGASDSVVEAEDAKSVTITLDREITASGEYTLVVPWDAFTLGSEFNSQTFKGMEVKYVIEGAEVTYDLVPASVDPENHATVSELQVISFKFDENIVLNETKKEAVVVTRTGEQHMGEYSVAEDGKTLVLTLNEKINKQEDEVLYILTLGEGTVTTADGLRGNEELTYDWTVEKTTGIQSVFANGEAADIYNVNGVCVKRNATDVKGLAKGIYVINGKKVVVK